MATSGTFTRHNVIAYFAASFAISWGAALVVIGGAGGMRGTTPASDPRFAYALVAMLTGPSLAGMLFTVLVYGSAGLCDLTSRLLTWRVRVRWYIVALLTAPALMLGTLLALSIVSAAFLPGIYTSDDQGALVRVALAIGLAAGLFEELGWTGFAVPALRRRHGVLATGLIVGVWWSAWHLLPNVWAARAAAGDMTLPAYLVATAFGVFAGYLTAFRVLMVWVYDRSGSLLLAMLMHVSLTSSLLLVTPIGLAGAHLQMFSFSLSAAVWAVVAWLVATRILTTGPGRRDRRRVAPPAAAELS